MTSLTDLHRQLEIMRPLLLCFALLQLRNKTTAEDAVQETLLAILEKPDSFAGQSSFRTYVTGILKYKIIDHLRAQKRETPLTVNDGDSETELIDHLFTADGHTVSPPAAWGEPESVLQQKDFFRILQLCLENLPEKTAQVFMMREWLELDAEDICKELGVSASNLWVILYRARLRLRECLDIHWFVHRQPGK